MAYPQTRHEVHYGNRMVRAFVERPPTIDAMFRAAVAQAPQRAVSVLKSAHTSPQHVQPAAHTASDPHLHAPPSHRLARPSGHAPQSLPQCPTSVDGSSPAHCSACRPSSHASVPCQHTPPCTK